MHTCMQTCRQSKACTHVCIRARTHAHMHASVSSTQSRPRARRRARIPAACARPQRARIPAARSRPSGTLASRQRTRATHQHLVQVGRVELQLEALPRPHDRVGNCLQLSSRRGAAREVVDPEGAGVECGVSEWAERAHGGRAACSRQPFGRLQPALVTSTTLAPARDTANSRRHFKR